MKITKEGISYINAFESIAKVNPRHCMIEADRIVFLVNAQDMGPAIGKKGITIKKVMKKMQKKVEVFSFTKKPEDFFRSNLKDIAIEKAEIKKAGDKNVLQLSFDLENRQKLMQNLGKFKRIKEIMKQSYGINEVKIR